MRVLVVSSRLVDPLGGAEQYVVWQVRQLVSAGHDVLVATGEVSRRVEHDLRAAGVTVRPLRVYRPYAAGKRGRGVRRAVFHLLDMFDPMAAIQVWAAAKQYRAEVIHVHRFQGLGLAVFRIPHIPVVHTVHDYALVDTRATTVRDDGEPLRSWAQRLRAKLASAFVSRALLIFPADATAARHRVYGLGNRISVEIVPHGWALESAEADGITESALRVRNGPVRFLYMGLLNKRKGVRLLVDSWRSGIPGAELFIAGTGDEELVALVAGRADYDVHYLGWVDGDEKLRALRQADVIVLPSIWPENFPIVVAEAMLAGLPVLTTTVAAPPCVTHEESGIVTDAEVKTFRREMERLVRNRDLRLRLAAGAMREAKSLDVRSHIDRLVGMYEQVSSAERAGGRASRVR